MRIQTKNLAQWSVWFVITSVISGTGTQVEALTSIYGLNFLNRTSFPTGFVFGVASSAYQVPRVLIIRFSCVHTHMPLCKNSILISINCSANNSPWLFYFHCFNRQKELQMKMARGQVYGILSLKNIQVLALSEEYASMPLYQHSNFHQPSILSTNIY